MKNYIEKNLTAMKEDLATLVSHNSILNNDALPFGLENRKVLDDAMKLMADKGFRTKNVDYYACYGEIGAGDEVIGILAHLDIVPAGDGWDSDPFAMVEKDGYLFGRGVSDDKGPAIASMYAMKYLLDTGYPFKKRVRLILGCNEETGSKCIEHYVEKEGHIDMGFTPDGGFPGIYAEKGMIGGYLVGKNTKFLAIKGGDAGNIVCKNVDARLPLGSFDEEAFARYLDEHEIKYAIRKDDAININVQGLAAHASTPQHGINAIAYLMEALYAAKLDDEFVNFFHKNFALTYNGELLGYEELKDEESNTTINFGTVSFTDGSIRISLDMRFPVQSSYQKCLAPLMKMNEENSFFESSGRGVEPLYFNQDTPMIKALMKAYVDVTGDHESKMEAIGGGTYAKAIHNCIAFGAGFPNSEDMHMHNANERLKIEDFKKQVEIYVEAIKNLNEA
ncbi:MAG: Sapep family Mn(2+)-dependent dipeptidase [Erysipelotrichaceae bacterium]|nr:Sapep family Mn(2+)-dependent dipeptidase [Erysipelotrichaceae bacterium]